MHGEAIAINKLLYRLVRFLLSMQCFKPNNNITRIVFLFSNPFSHREIKKTKKSVYLWFPNSNRKRISHNIIGINVRLPSTVKVNYLLNNFNYSIYFSNCLKHPNYFEKDIWLKLLEECCH